MADPIGRLEILSILHGAGIVHTDENGNFRVEQGGHYTDAALAFLVKRIAQEFTGCKICGFSFLCRQEICVTYHKAAKEFFAFHLGERDTSFVLLEECFGFFACQENKKTLFFQEVLFDDGVEVIEKKLERIRQQGGEPISVVTFCDARHRFSGSVGGIEVFSLVEANNICLTMQEKLLFSQGLVNDDDDESLAKEEKVFAR
jgi:hypothetical protein